MKGYKNCWWCELPKIDPAAPPDTQSGKPICPQCRDEYRQCFAKLPEAQKALDVTK